MKKLFGLTCGLMLLSSTAWAQTKDLYGVSFAPLVEKLLPGVVNISTTRPDAVEHEKTEISSANEYIRDYFLQDEGGRVSLGSGFLIDSQGYIITNSHVIDGASEITVRLNDDRKLEARVIGTDKMTDLALIKVEAGEPFPYVNLGDSDMLKVGDWVLAIGNPFGLGGSVTAGIVSAKSRDIDAGSYDNFIQTDASINQGSSGGPMFDMKGNVVGINTAIFSSNGGSMGIGFATPVNLSKFVIEQLKAKGKVERGWIGVKVTANDEKLILSDAQNFEGGVTVAAVTENSPAAEIGIEAGDILIGLNGNDIRGTKDFSRAIAETPVGDDVILRLWRNGQIKYVTASVKLMPEPQVPVVQTDEEIAQAELMKKPGYVADFGIVVEENNGFVVVTDVLAESKAYFLGIKSGDVIQKVDGRDVSTKADLELYVTYAKAAGGPPMELKVMRDGMSRTVQMTVGKTTQDDQN